MQLAPWWFQWVFSGGDIGRGRFECSGSRASWRQEGRGQGARSGSAGTGTEQPRRNRAVLRMKEQADGFRQDLARHVAWFEMCGLVHTAEITGEAAQRVTAASHQWGRCSAVDPSQTIVPAARAMRTSNERALRWSGRYMCAP
jgi:hypothetical protein